MRRFAALSLFAALFFAVSAPAQAQEAIGFGWDESSTQELVYRVSLATGEIRSVGAVDGLQMVTMGSQAVDGRNGNGLMIGFKENDLHSYLFLMMPADHATFAFRLDDSSRRAYQQTFVHPKTGEMFMLTYDSERGLNEIYRVALNLKDGKVELTSIGSLSGLSSYVVGNPKITPLGRIVIPANTGGRSSSPSSHSEADEETTTLITFDTGSGAVSSVNLAGGANSFAVCSPSAGTPRYFGYQVVRSGADVGSRIVEIAEDGSISEAASADSISTIEAGSAFCIGQKYYLLGTSSDGSGAVFSLDVTSPGAPLIVTALSQSNLKFIAPLNSAKAATAGLSTAASLREFAVIPAAGIKACAVRQWRLFTKRRYTTLRSAAAVLAKLRFSKRGRSYGCSARR